jgi:hypothetical protein
VVTPLAPVGAGPSESSATQLVAQAHHTDEIASRLHLSAYTVQDHLRSIFDKVGVSARGELVARLLFDHYAPSLAEQAPIAPTGWFAPTSAAERAAGAR